MGRKSETDSVSPLNERIQLHLMWLPEKHTGDSPMEAFSSASKGAHDG